MLYFVSTHGFYLAINPAVLKSSAVQLFIIKMHPGTTVQPDLWVDNLNPITAKLFWFLSVINRCG